MRAASAQEKLVATGRSQSDLTQLTVLAILGRGLPAHATQQADAPHRRELVIAEVPVDQVSESR